MRSTKGWAALPVRSILTIRIALPPARISQRTEWALSLTIITPTLHTSTRPRSFSWWQQNLWWKLGSCAFGHKSPRKKHLLLSAQYENDFTQEGQLLISAQTFRDQSHWKQNIWLISQSLQLRQLLQYLVVLSGFSWQVNTAEKLYAYTPGAFHTSGNQEMREEYQKEQLCGKVCKSEKSIATPAKRGRTADPVVFGRRVTVHVTNSRMHKCLGTDPEVVWVSGHTWNMHTSVLSLSLSQSAFISGIKTGKYVSMFIFSTYGLIYVS